MGGNRVMVITGKSCYGDLKYDSIYPYQAMVFANTVVEDSEEIIESKSMARTEDYSLQ